jgi:hypothetical protein
MQIVDINNHNKNVIGTIGIDFIYVRMLYCSYICVHVSMLMTGYSRAFYEVYEGGIYLHQVLLYYYIVNSTMCNICMYF